MANLHADENFRQAVVEELRKLGHDVLTAVDAGRANKGIKDADVLAFASSQKRAVLTFNRRDFFRLHRQTPCIVESLLARTITIVLPLQTESTRQSSIARFLTTN